MPSKFALVAIAALAVAHDIKTQIQARKAATLYLKSYEAFKETEAVSSNQIQYLLHLLSENGVEATEFDLIALNFHSHS